MTKFILLALLSISLLFTLTHSTKRIYYLYEHEGQHDKLTIETLKQNREKHPVYAINCKTLNCEKFKAHHYPALIFWNGPGTSYKSLYPANHQGLEEYFKSKETHPLKPIRDFMEGISLVEAFGVAFAVASFLYIVFSFLFKDRSGLEKAKSKKNL